MLTQAISTQLNNVIRSVEKKPMKKRPNSVDESGRWYRRVQRELQASPPNGWSVVTEINGCGVFLLPKDSVFHDRNQSGTDLPLVGSYRLVFELFRLRQSGAVKLSARVAGVSGKSDFDRLYEIARACACPSPRAGISHQTQSVAAWMAEGQREVFEIEDHVGMAQWVRSFLSKPPNDFLIFLQRVHDYLVGS
jgi:hypothetical protein